MLSPPVDSGHLIALNHPEVVATELHSFSGSGSGELELERHPSHRASTRRATKRRKSKVNSG